MITSKLMLAARGVVRDAEDGSISVFNIVEGLKVVAFPVLLPELTILTYLSRLPEDKEKLEGTIHLTLGEKELFSFPVSVDFQGKLRARQIGKIQGLVFSTPGEVRISLVIDGKEMNEYTFTVDKTSEPTAETKEV
jgi:Family of unknown function (DUF6941)